MFNARACVDCHQNPVAGGASQFTEIRAGHLDANGVFVNPTVPINDGANTITGRSIINDRAVIPEAQEHVPVTETIHALRATLNTLGDGFAEAIADQTLLEIAERQAKSGTGVHGEAVMVPVLEAPGQERVGRFGWKDQQPTILSFAADAYLNEMGITNRIRPKDVTDVGDTSALWGLRTRSRYMHDLTSLTLPNAIARHAGEADFATDAFNRLSDTEKQQVFVFLNSL